MDAPTKEKLIGYKNFLPQRVQQEYPEFCEYLKQQYPEKSITECCYLYFNPDEKGLCKTCGEPVKFLSFTRGYQDFCSRVCSNNNPDKQQKMQQTCLERYGVTNVFASDETKKKIVETNRRKYGVDYPQQSKEIHTKSKQTCLERYGVEYYSSTEESRQHKSDIKDETTKKVRKTAHKNFLATHPDILEFEDGWFTVKCPDPKCDRCKEKIFKTPQNIYYSRKTGGIDRCTNRTPLGVMGHPTTEKYIETLLDRHNISYVTKTRKILDNHKELDIYIPSKNVAIECNGCYWHSVKFKDDTYHYNKWHECKCKGINLLSIWEDWIMQRPDVVDSLVLSTLGVYKRLIYSSECLVKEVNLFEAEQFLVENSLLGRALSTVRLGLYYENELIMIMTFIQSKKDWKMIRVCSALNTQIVGGTNKLFEYFVENYHPNIVTAYACHDLDEDCIYKDNLGFQIENITKNNYWYINKQTLQRYHRSNFRKSILVKNGADPNLTEEQIMLTTEPYCDKYIKIYDSGQSTYIWKNPKQHK